MDVDVPRVAPGASAAMSARLQRRHGAHRSGGSPRPSGAVALVDSGRLQISGWTVALHALRAVVVSVEGRAVPVEEAGLAAWVDAGLCRAAPAIWRFGEWERQSQFSHFICGANSQVARGVRMAERLVAEDDADFSRP